MSEYSMSLLKKLFIQFTTMCFVFQSLSLVLLTVLITCRAAPAPPLFVDEKADIDSKDLNEVGPEENWQLFSRLMKTNAFDPSDSEKTKALLKEIEEFSQIATQESVTDEPDSTTEQPDNAETHSASTDWFESKWKNSKRSEGEDGFGKQDEGVEEIIKKLSNELKKLYAKVKQAITVMKNWYAIWKIANTVVTVAG